MTNEKVFLVSTDASQGVRSFRNNLTPLASSLKNPPNLVGEGIEADQLLSRIAQPEAACRGVVGEKCPQLKKLAGVKLGQLNNRDHTLEVIHECTGICPEGQHPPKNTGLVYSVKV